MKVIGITGGIGSGKSEILKYLNIKYKAIIMEADKIGHYLLNKDKEVYEKIIENFGEEVILSNRQIDRKKLSDICFNDSKKLEILNLLIHEKVYEEFKKNVSKAKKNNVKIFVIEAALLIECGYKKVLDEIWYIFCDKNIRIDRLMKNRGYSLKKCEDIIKSQIDDEDYKKACDLTIDNSKDLSFMKKQVDVAVKRLDLNNEDI